jgi:uncharacterized protein YjbJ (UPF0337 family)
MEWSRIEGNWKQLTRKVKEKWAKLTEEDLAAIDGRRDQLEGKIHQRYGFAMDHIRKEVDDWVRWQPLKSRHPGMQAKRTDISRQARLLRMVLFTPCLGSRTRVSRILEGMRDMRWSAGVLAIIALFLTSACSIRLPASSFAAFKAASPEETSSIRSQTREAQ